MIDAGLARLDPAANSALRGVARFATGLPAVGSAAKGKGMTPNEANRFVREEAEDALERSMTPTRERTVGSFSRAIPAAVTGASLFEPITGSLIGAGLSEAALSKIVPALMGSRYAEPFARWAMNMGNQTRAEAYTSLAAVFGNHALTTQERNARDTLMAGLRPARAENTLRFDANVDRYRAPSGRFATGSPVRHGERLDGSHPDDDDGDDK